MSIVLNEIEWAESAINNHELGKNSIETLERVAKYYYANGRSRKEVRDDLDKFILQCNPRASLSGWSDALDRIAKKTENRPPIELSEITVTKKELNKIDQLKGVQLKRLAFTLLCVAKYWDEVSKSNNHWVNAQDGEIMRMANINTSIKRQNLMYADLRDIGMIRFAKKVENLNVQVCYIEPGEVEIHIKDFRNLGYQYMKYCGGDYFECENCGMTVRYNNSNNHHGQKYCQACAVEMKIKQSVSSVMRSREKERVL